MWERLGGVSLTLYPCSSTPSKPSALALIPPSPTLPGCFSLARLGWGAAADFPGGAELQQKQGCGQGVGGGHRVQAVGGRLQGEAGVEEIKLGGRHRHGMLGVGEQLQGEAGSGGDSHRQEAGGGSGSRWQEGQVGGRGQRAGEQGRGEWDKLKLTFH